MRRIRAVSGGFPGKHWAQEKYLLLQTIWKVWGHNKEKPCKKTNNNLKVPDRQKLLLLLKSHKSCPTLCDPIEGNLPGSSVQARTLEWGAIAFSDRQKGVYRKKSHVILWLFKNCGKMHIIHLFNHYTVAFGTLTVFCNHHVYLVLGLSYDSRRKLHAH